MNLRPARLFPLLLAAAALVTAATAASSEMVAARSAIHRRLGARDDASALGTASARAPMKSLRPRGVVRSGEMRRVLGAVVLLYICAAAVLCISHRAQTWLIYLHWIKPPRFLFPLDNLRAHRLAGSARHVSAGGLRGWHLLPPGPPFSAGAGSGFFDESLARPNARVIIFFHGNSGHRAFPTKRVAMINLLSAHFSAHVVTFDYSGFGDSSGRPSESQIYADARDVYSWVLERVADDAQVIVYGQSLGTFAAVDLATHLSQSALTSEGHKGGIRINAVILDAPPASLMTAAMSHPTMLIFRIIPMIQRILRSVFHEKLDSLSKIRHVRAPLLILHGEDDTMIDIAQGVSLYEAAKRGGHPAVELVRFPNTGHINVNAAPDYLHVVHDFLDRHACRRDAESARGWW